MPFTPKLILTGGEPFVREDILDIALLFSNGSARAEQLTVPTSGFYPKRVVEFAKGFLESGKSAVLEIQLSIDGPKDVHDSIRGKGSFDNLMETWSFLNSLKKQRGNAASGGNGDRTLTGLSGEKENLKGDDTIRPVSIRKRSVKLSLRFNYTFSAINQDFFGETFDFVKNLEGSPTLDMVLLRGKPADESFSAEIDIIKYRRAARMLFDDEMKKNGGNGFGRFLAFRALRERDIIASHYKGNRKMSGCLAGRLISIIDEKGEVRPCEMLRVSFGNLKDFGYDFRRVWRSERAGKFRNDPAMKKCFCTFETAVRTTASFRIGSLGGMVWDTILGK
jgi:MoaA/NifB/PqqE/SkfB family radical SAM enzyme